jgi:hypothetical protein
MNNRWFWKSWNTTYRNYLIFLFTLFAASFVMFWFYYANGTNGVIAWEQFQEQKEIETTIHEFQLGPFELSVPANVYLIFEYFQGGQLRPSLFISYAFVFILIGAFVFFLAIFSALERFWYLAGMTLVILFIISLRLEVLKVFGLPQQWFPIGVMLLYGSLSVYINFFKPATSFQLRVLLFTLLTVFLALIIYFFAEVSMPFLYLSVTAYVAGLLLTMLFICIVAHEIPAAFLYLTTHVQSAKGMRHFLVVMIIYLVNLCLLYAHESGIINWSILYLNIYFVFSVSTIVGFWGWKHREVLYGNIMPFYPFGAYFIMTMAAVAFVTLGFLMGTANDAPLEAIKDVLIFSHIAFGLVFLLYVLSNFLGVIDRNLSAWKILYKPNRMPYETFRLGSLVVVLAFVFYNNWRDFVYNGVAGFWNSMGDLYVAIDRTDVAKTYFEQGRTYGFANHHSNYSIAYLHAGEFQWQQSHEYYDRAKIKRPTAFVYANDGNVYNWEENTFKAIHTMREGLTELPGTPELQTNAGFYYGKVHALDSALYWLNEARKHTHTKVAAETNFVGVAVQELLPIAPDSLAALFDLQNPGVAANALAMATITRTNFKHEVKAIKHGKLTLHEATMLNNYILSKAYTLSAIELAEAELIARDSSNTHYNEALLAAIAQAHYSQGNVNHALQLMSELSFVSAANQGKYNYKIGLWLLEQGSAETAALAFRYAVNYNYKNGTFYLAIAETENRNIPDALVLWDTLAQYGSTDEKRVATLIKPLLTMSFQEALQSTDAMKYQYCRYRISTRNTALFEVLINAMQEPEYKARSLVEMANRQLDADEPLLAERYSNDASVLAKSKRVKEACLFTHLQVLAAQGKLDILAETVKDVEFPLARRLDKLYFEALLNEAGGDKQEAAIAFNELATANSFYEAGVISAAQYAKLYGKDRMRAYNILSEAVQTNKTSVLLWKAYISESLAMGFDEYAATARIDLQKLLAQ